MPLNEEDKTKRLTTILSNQLKHVKDHYDSLLHESYCLNKGINMFDIIPYNETTEFDDDWTSFQSSHLIVSPKKRRITTRSANQISKKKLIFKTYTLHRKALMRSLHRNQSSNSTRHKSISAVVDASIGTCVDKRASRVAHEADVEVRVAQLKSAGLWSADLPKVSKLDTENHFGMKTHWDYVLEEMLSTSKDMATERRWRRKACRIVAQTVARYHREIREKEDKAKRDDLARRKKIAGFMTKEVKQFWNNAERLVDHKHESFIAVKRKQAMNRQLDLIVNQTEKFSSMLREGLGNDDNTSSDDDSEVDDTYSIASDEATETKQHEDNEELALLRKESEMPLEEILAQLPQSLSSGDESNPSEISISSSSEEDDESVTAVEADTESDSESENAMGSLLTNGPSMDDDKEFTGDLEMVDDECTIDEQEKFEETNAEDELAQLNADNELSVEDLLQKYQNDAPKEEVDSDNCSTDVGDESSMAVCDTFPTDDNSSVVMENKSDFDNNFEGISSVAEALQPTGFSYSTTQVKVPVPSLLKNTTLREYQHIGLEWLATMYDKKLNGILADEMGLGKTIQTIALLAHLACSYAVWGPHLVVVPTSVMINWEVELKKWAPGFKIITYYGSQKERKAKRKGWSQPNAFHVCVTSYKLVIQDNACFKRHKWHYLILDEAHNIKNFKSQRWQMLLSFPSVRRLLLTGTPLQNSLMELWSLLHFLMPQVFASHSDFKEWFSNPLTGMIEGSQEYNERLVSRLHKVLRPFLLRRMKSEVEKQMPKKYEHVIRCRLSKRQRFLYDDFMSRAHTKETLSSGHFMSVINVLMQLRKVCNHPDMFEPRPIVSPFIPPEQIAIRLPSFILIPTAKINLFESFISRENIDSYTAQRILELSAPLSLISNPPAPEVSHRKRCELNGIDWNLVRKSVVAGKFIIDVQMPHSQVKMFPQENEDFEVSDAMNRRNRRLKEWEQQAKRTLALLSVSHCKMPFPLYGWRLRRLLDCTLVKGGWLCGRAHIKEAQTYNHVLSDLVPTLQEALEKLNDVIERFVFLVPRICTKRPQVITNSPVIHNTTSHVFSKYVRPLTSLFHSITRRYALHFPETRLIEYDCGKLQTLRYLLRELKDGGHRVLIFTQMTKMLNILESFLNHHGHRYLRLDGSTRVDQRALLMERFNTDPKIFVFILSTRSGGIGVNLTGADTVIFYDSDWNPTMDAQAQDRCHRIGQTRDVHIYRLVSERTVEENILKKASQKRLLGDVAIEHGNFTSAFFQQTTIRDLFNPAEGFSEDTKPVEVVKHEEKPNSNNVEIESKDDKRKAALERALALAEDEQDAKAATQLVSEQKHELDEFDENLPLDNAREALNNVEAQIAALEARLKPIELYAVRFVEAEKPFDENSIDESDIKCDLKLDQLHSIEQAESSSDVNSSAKKRRPRIKKEALPLDSMRSSQRIAINTARKEYLLEVGEISEDVAPSSPPSDEHGKKPKASKVLRTRSNTTEESQPTSDSKLIKRRKRKSEVKEEKEEQKKSKKEAVKPSAHSKSSDDEGNGKVNSIEQPKFPTEKLPKNKEPVKLVQTVIKPPVIVSSSSSIVPPISNTPPNIFSILSTRAATQLTCTTISTTSINSHVAALRGIPTIKSTVKIIPTSSSSSAKPVNVISKPLGNQYKIIVPISKAIPINRVPQKCFVGPPSFQPTIDLSSLRVQTDEARVIRPSFTVQSKPIKKMVPSVSETLPGILKQSSHPSSKTHTVCFAPSPTVSYVKIEKRDEPLHNGITSDSDSIKNSGSRPVRRKRNSRYFGDEFEN